jgi:hypothetical protein
LYADTSARRLVVLRCLADGSRNYQGADGPVPRPALHAKSYCFGCRLCRQKLVSKCAAKIKRICLGWYSPGEAAFQDLLDSAAQCIKASRRKIDLGAEFGIGIVLSYALEEVEARCAVTYRSNSVSISKCRYHFRAPLCRTSQRRPASTFPAQNLTPALVSGRLNVPGGPRRTVRQPVALQLYPIRPDPHIPRR